MGGMFEIVFIFLLIQVVSLSIVSSLILNTRLYASTRRRTCHSLFCSTTAFNHPEETEEKMNSSTPEEKKLVRTIVIDERDIEESFVKGSGNGGQKINTTANRVVLVHKPTGLTVSCQDARDLSTNRKWARSMLLEKLDFHYNGSQSKLAMQQEKVRKRKKNASRKAKKKYSENKTKETAEVEGDNISDSDDDEKEIAELIAKFKR